MIIDDGDISVAETSQPPSVETIARPATLDIARPTDQTISNVSVQKVKNLPYKIKKKMKNFSFIYFFLIVAYAKYMYSAR